MARAIKYGLMYSAAGVQESVSNVYDALGRKIMTITRDGKATLTHYDAAGRPDQIDLPGKYTIRYAYDPDGNKTNENYTGGRSIIYGYDNRGRMVSRKLSGGTWGGGDFTYTMGYDSAGNLNSYASGSFSNIYEYDELGIMTAQVSCIDQKTNSYIYDKMGRLTNETAMRSGKSVTKDTIYDLMGRVTSVRSSQDGKTAVLGYDLNGKDIIVFTHTEVPPELEGRGFGSQLARAGLDYARQHGLKVVSLCSFMSAFIERHLDYQDLLKT